MYTNINIFAQSDVGLILKSPPISYDYTGLLGIMKWNGGMECDFYFHSIYLFGVMEWTSELMKMQRKSKEIDISFLSSFLSSFHSNLNFIPSSFHSIILSMPYLLVEKKFSSLDIPRWNVDVVCPLYNILTYGNLLVSGLQEIRSRA